METLSWSTLEFEEKDRHPDWIWTAGLLFVISSVISFFYGNIFFGIFLLVAGAMTVISSSHKPKILSVVISEAGVSINGEIVDHKRIKNFWIDEKGKVDKLLMAVSGSFVPVIALPLNGVRTEDLRAIMLKYNSEEELVESLGIKIFERIGF